MNTQEIQIMRQTTQILDQVQRVIVGKDEQLRWVLAAILAKGHILLEDVPGVGKTTMALVFSQTLQMEHGRVQFTPDVLPSDVTGYSILEKDTGRMVYSKGAILCNLFLADELNRATSRTQSALLEAMEEGQVTVDGVCHPIPKPFTVIATQNPTGAAGTQLLPDSQMDRFMIRLSLGYPTVDDELNMVLNRQAGDPLKSLSSVVSREEICRMQEITAQTHVSREAILYAIGLINATRNHPHLERGASPRTTLAVVALSKAVARLHDRDYVVPEDIRECFPYTVTHRLLVAHTARARNIQAADIVQEILKKNPAPKLR